MWEERQSPVDAPEEGPNKLVAITVMNDAVMESESLVYTLLNMALGEVGTATALHPSTREEEKDRRDKMKMRK